MAITLTSGSATIGSTEYFLPNSSTTPTDQTDDCLLQVFIDATAMATGDRYEITIYEAIGGGSQLELYTSTIEGAQSSGWVSPSLIVGEGWNVSVTKLAGTDRTIRWSLRKVA